MARHPHPRSAISAACGLAALWLAGCGSGNGRVHPPNYSSDAGAAACQAYDANRDGAIADKELDRVPALRAAMRQVDRNDDKKITADEIDARVRQWLDSRVGESPVRCTVTLDGTPLADAEVLFEPEAFLGSNVQPASGTSGPNGVAGITMAKEHLADAKFAGVANGWYKIRVTSKTKSLPACYNTDTRLGCEVAMDAHWVSESEITISLKSSPDK